MHNDPILAGPKEYTEHGTRYRITAVGGLNYLRGNSAPYFSVTGDIKRKAGNGRWVDDASGCIHDDIAHHFPHLKPLIDLHLRNIDGAPMHGGYNGHYWLTGGQFFPIDKWLDCGQPINKRKEYLGNELMASPEEVEAIFEKFRGCAISPTAIRESKERFMREEVEPRRDAWKLAAEKAIIDFNLKVFGDKWENVA